MSKELGPMFGAEVVAAIGQAPITWSDTAGSIEGRDALTEEQNTKLDIVIAAHKPDAPPVPQTISDRQFAHALKNAGVITHAEAMAFVQTGAIPATLKAVVSGIGNKIQREDTELIIAGATTFDRSHPMTLALAAGMGWSAAQLDVLWIAAAKL